jgi:hypothetical protein
MLLPFCDVNLSDLLSLACSKHLAEELETEIVKAYRELPPDLRQRALQDQSIALVMRRRC